MNILNKIKSIYILIIGLLLGCSSIYFIDKNNSLASILFVVSIATIILASTHTNKYEQ